MAKSNVGDPRQMEIDFKTGQPEEPADTVNGLLFLRLEWHPETHWRAVPGPALFHSKARAFYIPPWNLNDHELFDIHSIEYEWPRIPRELDWAAAVRRAIEAIPDSFVVNQCAGCVLLKSECDRLLQTVPLQDLILELANRKS